MSSTDELVPTVASLVRAVGLRADAFIGILDQLDLGANWQWTAIPSRDGEPPERVHPAATGDVLGQLLHFDPATGDPEVFISIPNTALPVFEVAEATIAWEGAHSPAPSPRSEDIEMITIIDVDAPARLAAAVASMRERRRARYRACRECGNVLAPEHFMEHDLCHGCAQENHGVVF